MSVVANRSMKTVELKGYCCPCPLDKSCVHNPYIFIKNETITYPQSYCEIQVIETMKKPPQNIRIGCAQHGYWLEDCFCSVKEAVSAWNAEMTRIKNENN